MAGHLGLIGGVVGAGAELLVTHGVRWQEGWAVGTTIGGIIDGSKKAGVSSGKLNDLHVGGSSYGTTIPRAWGKVKLPGAVVWVGNYLNNSTKIPSYSGYVITLDPDPTGATDINGSANSTSGSIPSGTYVTAGGVSLVLTGNGTIRRGRAHFTVNPLSSPILAGDTVSITAGTHLVQHKKKAQSSGGGSGGGASAGTDYWYTASFAVMVCEASLFMTDETFSYRAPVFKRIWANDKIVYDIDNPAHNKLTITFYNGTETQTPDTLIQSFEGAGSTPGYRGIVYFVVEGMDLTDYGQSLPNFQVELWTNPISLGDIAKDVFGLVGIRDLYATTTTAVSTGASSIPISELQAPLISGSKVVFGAVTVTLNAIAPYGATSLSVNAISGPIALGSTAILRKCLDTSLATTGITGYPVTDLGNAQDILDPLFSSFAVDIVEVDGVVTLVPRGGTIVASIPNTDLGAVSENGEIRTTITRTRQVRGELHSEVNITFFDLDKQFLQNSQQDIKQTAPYNNIQAITVPFTLKSLEGKQMAARILETEYAELDPFSFTTSWKYLGLRPTDPINIQDDKGTWFRVRILDMEEAETSEFRYNAVVDYINSTTQNVLGDSGSGGGLPGTNVPIPSIFKPWSGTELQDSDTASPGFYVVATGPNGWLGGTVFYSTDGGTTYNQGPTIDQRSVFGITSSALTDASGGTYPYWDTTNSFGVILTNDGFSSLETVTEDSVLNGNNICVVGNEIAGVVNASLSGTNTYNLSHLRRGIRGSTFTGHSSGEKFILASQNAVRISLATSYVGTTVYVKVVSPYQTLSDVTAQSVIIVARSMTPYEITVTNHASLIASATVLGHVKIGSGLTINATTGVLSSTVGGTTPAGSDTQIQYNNAGVYGASANLTFNGTQFATPKIVTSAFEVRDSGGSLKFSADATNYLSLFSGPIYLRNAGDINHSLQWDSVLDGGKLSGWNGNFLYSAKVGRYVGKFDCDNGTTIYGLNTGAITLTVIGENSQTVDLQRWNSYSGTTLASVSLAGIIKASGYKSSAGNSGITVTTGGLTIENGLVVSGTITISGSSLSVSDEGTLITTTATSLNFSGVSVIATQVSGAVTVKVVDFPFYKVAVKNINYSVLNTDRYVAFVSLTAAHTITLGDAYPNGVTTTVGTGSLLGGSYFSSGGATFPDNTVLIIKDETGNCSSTNTITISSGQGAKIDGASTKAINTPYGVVRLINNGADWFTL